MESYKHLRHKKRTCVFLSIASDPHFGFCLDFCFTSRYYINYAAVEILQDARQMGCESWFESENCSEYCSESDTFSESDISQYSNRVPLLTSAPLTNWCLSFIVFNPKMWQIWSLTVGFKILRKLFVIWCGIYCRSFRSRANWSGRSSELCFKTKSWAKPVAPFPQRTTEFVPGQFDDAASITTQTKNEEQQGLSSRWTILYLAQCCL